MTLVLFLNTSPFTNFKLFFSKGAQIAIEFAARAATLLPLIIYQHDT